MATATNAINEATTGICGFTGTAFTGTPLSAHTVLLGGATSSTIAQTATGSSGQVLQSGGASADPTYSTATYPASSGGTGKILYDNGTNFVESTPTFPASASATSRKIVVSDGTNWVASTETWATPGTSGNVLTSDGTNWTSASASGGGISVASGSITSAQVKTLHGTPFQIVAAPGSGKVVQVISSIATMNYGGNNAFVNGGAQAITLDYGTSNGIFNLIGNSNIIATSNQVQIEAGATAITGAYTIAANTAINAYNSSATEISGNAAGDNTISYSVVYRTVTIP